MSNELALPERPNLDQLRKQAREHQRSNPGLTLTEAKLQLARQYGFASWTKLKHHVEEVLGLRTHLQSFVEAALGGRLQQADKILGEHPELLTTSVVALMTGDLARTRGIDPLTPIGPQDWVPLLYVCFTRYYQNPQNEPKLVEVARDLLERGADPNASYIDTEFPELPETCLYGVCGRNFNAEITRLLLEKGATPQDGEALYHGTESANHEPLRLVLEAGGKPQGANAIAHMLDREDLEGLRLILDHYGPPDDELGNALHHAIVRRRSIAHLEKLLDHGADVNHPSHWATPYLRARVLAQPETAAFLASRGANTALTPEEQTVVACVEGGPLGPATSVPMHLQWALSDAADRGDIAAIRRMIDVGFDVNVGSGWGRTALHQAAWSGRAEIIRLLLANGGDLSVKDPHHQGTPLSWCIAGASWDPNPTGDYIASLTALFEAGGGEYMSRQRALEMSAGKADIRAVIEKYMPQE